MAMYLKKQDGQEFGPINLTEMKRWAAEGRVEPSDVVSEDRDSWKPAPEYGELGMEWVVDLPDGQEYGPVNVLALVNLLQEDVVRPESEIRRKDRGQKSMTGEVLLRAMIERHRDLEKLLPPDPDADASNGEGRTEPVTGPLPPYRIDELAQANRALEQEVARWREMYAKIREEARQREDLLAHRLDEISEARAGGLMDPETAVAGSEDLDLTGLTSAEVRQRYYAAQKEARKWRVMYEQERTDAHGREDQLNQRIEEFQKSEAEMRGMLTSTSQRLTIMEKNYATLMTAAESKNGEQDVALAGQLGGLLQAYSDMSQSYDTLFSQLKQREQDLTAAIESRKELEEVAEERFTEMEEMVYREQKDADRARRQLADLEMTYQQIVRSYREMNDRFIDWRQRLSQGNGSKEHVHAE